jgi:tRNA threonylcarbamoyladenosine modification (KEOPS) complex Cgi121 subunit
MGVTEPKDDIVLLRIEVEEGEAEAFMDQVLRRAEEAGAVVLVMDDDMVFGEDHIRSAAYHAQKAIDEGRNSSDSLAMETLLYASGMRQLAHAIDKMTVKDDTSTVAVAVIRGSMEPEGAWRMAPPREDFSKEARLLRFGLTAEEIGTLRQGSAEELVLERVAGVDVIKK